MPRRGCSMQRPELTYSGNGTMRIIIVSGLSGSGKSVALHMLEDLGFYCIDNIPAALLKPFISHTVRSPRRTYERTAIGLDARNTAAEIATVPQLIDELKRSGIQCEVLFLVTERRGAAAALRRNAPQAPDEPRTTSTCARPSRMERQLLEPIVNAADLVIDTSRMGVHELREIIHQRVEQRTAGRLSHHVRVVRLQARHSGRCGLRVRRALAAESLLGARAAQAHRARCRRGAVSRGAGAMPGA